MEITYPNLPFYPALTNTSTLAQYIAYWFGFGISIAIIIAVVSLIIAGIQLMTSAGNTGAVSEAKDKIKNSILGLFLLLSSFLILRTINPALVTPSLTSLGEVPGVFYTNGEGGETKPAPVSEADTANIPDGFDMIIYKCAEGAYSPNLFIWKFPNKNFTGNNGTFAGITVDEISCGNYTNLGGTNSFKMAFKSPGIYYFLEENCAGYMSGSNLSDQSIAEPFKGNIKSIKIVNETASNSYFGIIFHEQADIKKSGPCDVPRLSNNVEECVKIYDKSTNRNIATNSANIFKWNTTPLLSGTGIDFYSHPYGWAAGSGAGYYKIVKEQFGRGVFFKNAAAMNFTYVGIKGPLAKNCRSKPSCSQTGRGQQCCPCKTFQNCFGSMKVRGNYLVALYSFALNSRSGLSCQVFLKDVPNFKTTEIIAEENNINFVDIIPLK